MISLQTFFINWGKAHLKLYIDKLPTYCFCCPEVYQSSPLIHAPVTKSVTVRDHDYVHVHVHKFEISQIWPSQEYIQNPYQKHIQTLILIFHPCNFSNDTPTWQILSQNVSMVQKIKVMHKHSFKGFDSRLWPWRFKQHCDFDLELSHSNPLI